MGVDVAGIDVRALLLLALLIGRTAPTAWLLLVETIGKDVVDRMVPGAEVGGVDAAAPAATPLDVRTIDSGFAD